MTPASQRALLPALLLLLALAGCGGDEGHPAAAFAPPPTPVELAVVEARGVEDRFTALGTVEASEWIPVAAELSARVVDIPFDEGADVRKGQVLVRLDASQVAAEVQRAEAQLANQRAWLERTRSLVAEGIAAQQSLEDIETDARVAEADLAVARARLAKTVIVAPFDGVIGSRHVSPGAVVAPGQTIAHLVSLDEIKIAFSAPERFLSHLAVGSDVAVATTAWPDDPISGRVAVIDPVVDPATRTVRVIARAANPQRRLKPGMSADVSVVVADRPTALVVPAEAVFFEGTQALVFVVGPDDTVVRVPVTLGTRQSDVVEVLSGLEAGQRVVAAGHQKLYPGAKVAPATPPPAASASAPAP